MTPRFITHDVLLQELMSSLNEDVEMVYGYCALLIFRKHLPLACASDDPFLNLAN